ncbi:MAG: hypothetical protein A2Y38_10120 [Spirochaetes bacterium GWB1_59_5]|nr:MAG: hypothetical protein A2Y38_10120 [Spirochaetes bacterium GWB1_59_5]
MSLRALLACCAIACIWGGVGGWIVAMHSARGKAYKAQAEAAIADRERLEAQTSIALGEIHAYKDRIALQTMQLVRKTAKERRNQ